MQRWLHEHIFKVGWLLTKSFPLTTVLYYILFLPGIALHEATLWLAATLLRAGGQVRWQFPQPQEIGELRLQILRLPASTSRVKRWLVHSVPLVTGLLALWWIVQVPLQSQEALDWAGRGGIDDIGRALRTLTGQPDFALWLYVAFTIANTMFPALHGFTFRRVAALFAALPFAIFLLWMSSALIDLPLVQSLEALLSGLILLLLQILFIDAVVLVALGTVEALLERVGTRSATFRAGKIIVTRDGTPAPSIEDRQPRSGSNPPRSIAQLRLPIPGPPSDEPVSRRADAVLGAAPAAPDEPSKQTAPARPIAPLQRAMPPAAPDSPSSEPLVTLSDGASSRFQRPFAPPADAPSTRMHTPEEPGPADTEDGIFARPFRKDEPRDDAP